MKTYKFEHSATPCVTESSQEYSEIAVLTGEDPHAAGSWATVIFWPSGHIMVRHPRGAELEVGAPDAVYWLASGRPDLVGPLTRLVNQLVNG